MVSGERIVSTGPFARSIEAARVDDVRKVRPMSADDYLRLAIQTGSPDAASAYAEKGLRTVTDQANPETLVLLLREIYRSHLYARRLRSAHAVARKMVRVGVAQEIAYTDLARAQAALGWWHRAAESYRVAARIAPASRRAMHWGLLAAALQRQGRHAEGLSALERAARWSLGSRPLYRAQMALARLEMGASVDEIDDLEERVTDLECARCGEGYGRFVLGLLYARTGDRARARRNLKQFVKRNAADPLRSLTLAWEVRRARDELRRLRGGNASPSSPPAP